MDGGLAVIEAKKIPDRAEPIRTEELIKRRKPANLPSAGSPKDDES